MRPAATLQRKEGIIARARSHDNAVGPDCHLATPRRCTNLTTAYPRDRIDSSSSLEGWSARLPCGVGNLAYGARLSATGEAVRTSAKLRTGGLHDTQS